MTIVNVLLTGYVISLLICYPILDLHFRKYVRKDPEGKEISYRVVWISAMIPILNLYMAALAVPILFRVYKIQFHRRRLTKRLREKAKGHIEAGNLEIGRAFNDIAEKIENLE